MDKKDPLTKEAIRQKFKSQFDLVNYAIKLSKQFIHSGRAPRIRGDNKNPAVIIIGEIEEGKDQFDDIDSLQEETKEMKRAQEIIEEASFQKPAPPQKTERKKPRRILT